MELTGLAKEEFRKHMKLQGLSLGLQEKFMNTEIIEWLDTIGMYISIDPHLGGGNPVFYPSVEFRDDEFIDAFEYPTWDDGSQYYTPSRQEATTAAITKANEIYNERYGK